MGICNDGAWSQPAHIHKYNSTLDSQWTATSSTPSSKMYLPYSIELDSSGDLIVGLRAYSNPNSDAHVAFAKFASSDGTQDWIVTTPSGNHRDEVRYLHVDSSDNLYVVGDTYSDSLNSVSTPSSNWDAFLLKYSAPNTTPSFSGLDATATHTEGSSAVVLDANVTISDTELDALNSSAGNYNGASLTIARNGGACKSNCVTAVIKCDLAVCPQTLS